MPWKNLNLWHFFKKLIYSPNNQGYPVSLFKQNKIIHNKLEAKYPPLKTIWKMRMTVLRDLW